MKRIFKILFPSKNNSLTLKIIHNKSIQTIKVNNGTILLDAINESGLKNVSVFGICDKQLSCHSCAVNIVSLSNSNVHLKEASEEEKDVLSELKSRKYNENTRMSCQIVLDKLIHDNMIIEIFDNEIFNNENNDFI